MKEGNLRVAAKGWCHAYLGTTNRNLRTPRRPSPREGKLRIAPCTAQLVRRGPTRSAKTCPRCRPSTSASTSRCMPAVSRECIECRRAGVSRKDGAKVDLTPTSVPAPKVHVSYTANDERLRASRTQAHHPTSPASSNCRRRQRKRCSPQPPGKSTPALPSRCSRLRSHRLVRSATRHHQHSVRSCKGSGQRSKGAIGFVSIPEVKSGTA